MTKHLTVILAFFVVTLCTQVGAADISCVLSSNYKNAAADDTDQLIIRSNDLNIRAILMTKYSTTVYSCTEAIIDDYECYGFLEKPFEAPTQLNVGDTKAGSTVIRTTLNLGFLKAYAADDYKASDRSTRRFSIDSYTIKSCEKS